MRPWKGSSRQWVWRRGYSKRYVTQTRSNSRECFHTLSPPRADGTGTTGIQSMEARPADLVSRACRAGIIIAGHHPSHGGSVYSIPLGGSLHRQSYAIGGSGSTYIYGYCDSYWKENMSEADGIGFVKGALREAIKWDGSSGGVIRMVVLTDKGAKRLLFLPDQGYEGPGDK